MKFSVGELVALVTVFGDTIMVVVEIVFVLRKVIIFICFGEVVSNFLRCLLELRSCGSETA